MLQGAVIMMNPQNGEIYAMVNSPEFSLTKPYELVDQSKNLSEKQKNEELNKMWRNGCVSDTYEPGSTFKIVTALDYFRQKGSLEGYSYLCQGSITVDDHTIQCYNGTVHGQEDFYSAFAHSCNCAFADMGLGLGGDTLKSTAEDLLFNRLFR